MRLRDKVSATAKASHAQLTPCKAAEPAVRTAQTSLGHALQPIQTRLPYLLPAGASGRSSCTKIRATMQDNTRYDGRWHLQTASGGAERVQPPPPPPPRSSHMPHYAFGRTLFTAAYMEQSGSFGMATPAAFNANGQPCRSNGESSMGFPLSGEGSAVHDSSSSIPLAVSTKSGQCAPPAEDGPASRWVLLDGWMPGAMADGGSASVSDAGFAGSRSSQGSFAPTSGSAGNGGPAGAGGPFATSIPLSAMEVRGLLPCMWMVVHRTGANLHMEFNHPGGGADLLITGMLEQVDQARSLVMSSV